MDPMSALHAQSTKYIRVMFLFDETGDELLWFPTADVSYWTASGLFSELPAKSYCKSKKTRTPDHETHVWSHSCRKKINPTSSNLLTKSQKLILSGKRLVKRGWSLWPKL